MIYCRELNKSFKTTKELFKALRESNDHIIAKKKSQIFKSCEKGGSLIIRLLDPLKLSVQLKGLKIDDDFYYIGVNATKILDSHLDLHWNGLWKKTVKDQQGKNYLVDSHILSVGTTIARKEHIEMFTAIVPFSLIGKNFEGDTEILIYKVKKDKVINPVAKEWLDSGDSIEASVRMQYVDIIFAMDSDAKEDIKFKANFDKYFKEIVNIDDFDTDIIYFWIVKEAKNIQESSLVLFASNPATGLITNEPSGTSKTKPPIKDTQKQNNILINFLN